jgi:hypothetical protein
MSHSAALRLLPAAALLLVLPCSRLASASPASLSAAEIVAQMSQHNQMRNDRLAHYHSVRHYHVEYNGFSAHLAANMDVDATYDAQGGKSFRVLSQSGSRMLCDKVLKRAVDSEREASADRKATALSPANYNFTLLGAEPVNGRPAYILQVEPVSASKYLYRGRVWVDAADFALVKLEATPAKNPSFWISKTLIDQSFVHSGEFWLPARNRSETHVRVGGAAVFTIDYGEYQFQPAAPALASNASLR